MRKMIFAAVAALVCVFSAQAQKVSVDELPSIEVRGRAEREVTPDELTVTIGINERDYKGKYTLADKQDDLIKVLKRHNVNTDEDLRIGYMGSNVKVKLLKKQIKSLVSATYVVTLKSAEQMQKIVEDLAEKEISSVSLIDAKYTKKSDLEMQLAFEAVKDAKKRAQSLSEALGQGLGGALQVSVRPMWSENPIQRYRTRLLAKNAAVEEAEMDSSIDEKNRPQIAVTEEKYTVEVVVRFSLKTSL